MRLTYLLPLLVVLSGIAVAQQQETNFPQGPQYLITTPSPTILQSIETPSMSPSEQPGVLSPQTGYAEPVPAYLPGIYWGWNILPTVQYAPVTVPVPNGFPPGYNDVGVWGTATGQWLHEHDYGMTLAQAARYWKEHKLHATHVYTNADIDRMRGG